MEAVCLRWLKKPKVLRCISLASFVVGLICYTLSSTFNHSLGNWTWWKMLLYIVISFIIYLAVLFAPARSSSISFRLEVHLAFLVLILTSVYSFLLENVVKGKPDVYSLISCAAFAIMSLGLSNLTQFGFQIDLLHFFCELLIIQLLMMKWWSGFVGAGFSYCLLQLRFYTSNREVDPVRVSSVSHVINMPQEGGTDNVTQSISHPQDDVNLVMDDPPSEITRHPIKNPINLNFERADSISTGKTSSTRADSISTLKPSSTRADSISTGKTSSTRADSVSTGKTSSTRTDSTRLEPTRGDLRRITSAKFRREPNDLPRNPFSRAEIREPRAKTIFGDNIQEPSAKTTFRHKMRPPDSSAKYKNF
ncbi:hypothetical protein PHAVU_001G122400 [Phaseolus vulgaris]|uniref:Uncharacterized protein n=1 Tax=Phaseolus vulgaris TaxID=3885 RepID=V7CV69_PHAVU|nr:hypothetical protein PHAVU_001G122400g [Phaseolus vulgaris]ESW34077.1 hypothetical protein PHAVU_001G122400g [Phaseolus vulgaris]